MPTTLFTDPVFLLHRTGPHVERPQRMQAVTNMLAESGLTNRCTLGTVAPVSEADVLAVHDASVLALVRKVAGEGGGWLDGDTVMVPESLNVALCAAGACVSAVDAVLATPGTNAFAVVRPPGHHATIDTSMGFCLFNTVAIAARHAQRKHGVGRVLIVDFDTHHGNGTEDIFYADASVHFLSIHRYGSGFYPGTGPASATGTGAGQGTTTNVPIKLGTSRAEYLAAFRRAVESAADAHRPELIIISAGFDAHARDPIGPLGLESEDYGTLTRIVLDVAKVHCGGRVASCLEGGYDLHALAESVAVHLGELLAG